MSVASRVSQPTYYQILQVPQNDRSIDPVALKAAYHRTLLIHHPDKKTSSPAVSSSVKHHQNHAYSIDQITKAYKTLSNVSKRVEYSRQLEEQIGRLSTGVKDDCRAGVETLDLEDLVYNDDTAIWSRKCRCGEERGYMLAESDLESESEQGEIHVACKGCSLSIRVLFDVAPAGDDVEVAS